MNRMVIGKSETVEGASYPMTRGIGIAENGSLVLILFSSGDNYVCLPIIDAKSQPSALKIELAPQGSGLTRAGAQLDHSPDIASQVAHDDPVLSIDIGEVTPKVMYLEMTLLTYKAPGARSFGGMPTLSAVPATPVARAVTGPILSHIVSMLSSIETIAYFSQLSAPAQSGAGPLIPTGGTVRTVPTGHGAIVVTLANGHRFWKRCQLIIMTN